MKIFFSESVQPIAPFKHPIQAITTPITGVNSTLLCVSADWLPVVLGAMNILLDSVHWKGTEADILYAMGQVEELITMSQYDACQCVLACIQNSPEVIQEIIDKGFGSPDKALPEDVLGADWIDGLSCNKDNLWGACQYVIDGIFDSTAEVLQRIALATTPFEGISKAFDDIPIIGFLTNAGDLINWIADTAYDAWYAADSQAVRDELACELLCYAEANCAISYEYLELILSRHAVKVFLEPTSLEDMVEWFVDIVFSSDPAKKVCATIAMLGLYVIKHGGSFGEWLFSIRSIEQLARIGHADNPNTSWSVLCTTCTFLLWVKFDNPDDSNFELIEIASTGQTSTYVNEIGNNAPSIESIKWYESASATYQWDAWVKVPLPDVATVTQIDFDWEYFADYEGQTTLWIKLYDSSDNLLGSHYYSPTLARQQWHTASFTGISYANTSYIIVDVSRSSNSDHPTWLHYVDNIKVTYAL